MLKPLTLALAACSGAASAHAGDITHQYGYDFLPVRDAGNAPYISNGGSPLYGGVDYEYRVSSTVTTAIQWADFLTDFVDAFGYAEVAGTSYEALSSGYVVTGGTGFVPVPGFEQYPINTP